MRLRSVVLACSLVAGTVGLNASALAEVGVDDPPVCDAQPADQRLWPPNHKWRTVTNLPTATDPDVAEGEDTLTASASTVVQDEPVNGKGDGNTAPDARFSNGDTLQVRSERAGPGDGRFYIVSITFTDSSGDSVTCESNVVVPHDRSKKKVPVDSGPPYFDSFATS